MYTCAKCAVTACKKGGGDKLPKNCPMRDEQMLEDSMKIYKQPENEAFYISASEIESLGHFQWVRVKETMMLCRQMGYHRIGLAFCGGLHKEAKILNSILEREGFEVISVMCKAGGQDKTAAGISEERKVHPGGFEAMCNPVFQAKLLNSQNTEFNIVVGLCVGHDSLFYKYSEALVTTLVAKDRVLAHNPAGALYCADGYFRDRMTV